MPKLTAKARKELPKESFALPEGRMFPIHDPEHIKLAWGMLKRAKSLTDDQRKAAGKAIVKAAKAAKIDTADWQLKETKTDDTDPDEIDLPAAEDLTVVTIGAMTEPAELCAAWCLIHEMPLSSVERSALQAAVQTRCSDLNISMYSWDYYDGGKLSEMHEAVTGKTEADAAKATPTLEAIGVMDTIDLLRTAYVDIREASLSAEVREGLEAAIRSRADTIGINWWTWQQKTTEQAAEGSAADATQFITDSASGADVYVGPVILLDAGDAETKRPLRARFRVTRANYRNHNARVYPLEHIQDAVQAANEDIAAGRMVPGEMYHPEAYRALDGAIMFKSAFERQAFKWERFELAPDGTVYGDAAILEHTPAGALIGGHIRSGVAVPVSVRWLTPNGSTVRTLADGAKAEVPNKPLRIKTVDGVPNPATAGSESVQMLDEAAINVILAAPAAPAEGAAAVSTPDANNPSTTDSGAQGVKEDETVEQKQIIEALKTPDGQAMLKEMFGAQFDSAVKASEQFEAQEKERSRKVDVQAVVDGADFSKFDDSTRQTITDAVAMAIDSTQAKVILDAQIDLAHKMEAKVHAARMGYPAGAVVGQVRVDTVNEAKPWRAGVEKLKVAFDDAARSQGTVPDGSLRKVNKQAVDRMVARFETQHGRSLYDATQRSMGDASLTLADDSIMSMADASTTTALVLNQPLVQLAIIEQAYQDMEALQFITTRTDAEGSVFKIPAEYYTPAASAATNDIIVAEQGAIPESNVNLTFLTFAPQWRRIATRLTQDVVRELKAGPARYDVLGRSLYHVPREKARAVDLATYLEMIVTSDEYGAVAVVSEGQTGGTAVSDGTNKAFKYTLKRGTNTYAPVVRPRQVLDLTSAGAKSVVTRNNISITIASVAKTRGYLDATGNIQGGEYAVDFETGVLYVKSGQGVVLTTADPVCSYTYATNFDSFDLTVPAGVKAEDYYNKLVTRIDTSAALMGSSPRFKKPNLALMSLNAATYIQNAALFYKLNSPQGTELLSDQTYFGRRNGVNLASINAPWAVGDNRMLLTQIGATQYGVDTPFEIEGPVQSYKVSGTDVQVIDEKIWYGREHSAIFTPQPADPSGATINPFNRSVVLFKS